MDETNYGFSIEVPVDFDTALQLTVEGLKEQGFGVLTEIDVKETLKKKLDVDFRNYRILGACNPPLAHRALQAETEIGLLLPCNVIVYEAANGKTRVSAINPVAAMSMVDSQEVEPIADEVRQRLQIVLSKLTEETAQKA